MNLVFVAEPIDPVALKTRAGLSNVHRLVTAFREHGHLRSKVDPLGLTERRYGYIFFSQN